MHPSKNQKSSVKLGIIGAGRIGRVHAKALTHQVPMAKVEMISDVRSEAAQGAAEEFRIPKACEDYHEILKSDVDGVIICSSTDTHSRILEEAAAHGKHIFCEKPIDLDITKIENALKAVDQAGVALQIGFNRRFDPNFKKIKDSISEGKIGTPQIVRITSRDPSPPPIDYVKVSGGMFLDMTIHDFDMARFITGEEIEEVFVHGANLVDPHIEKAGDIDTAVVSIKYKNGALCTIDNSRKAVYGYDQRLEVFGSKGCLLSENNTPTRTQLWDATGQREELPLFFFLQRYMESYVSEMQEFVSCVSKGEKPSCSGYDGLVAVVVGLAAKKSLAEKRPVKIQEIRKFN